MTQSTINALLRPLSIPLMAEGALMLLCLIPAIHFHDGTTVPILISSLFTFILGLLIYLTFDRNRERISDRRIPYLIVTSVWIVFSLFGTLPFLTTGVVHGFIEALFESMSGLTSTGATIFSEVEHLPASILFWRSISQWVGGFGIVLMVLAIIPSLGINRYSLYTAEASGADNQGLSVPVNITIRRTLTVYISLTLVFILLQMASGMHLWDAVNLTFANISSGGFSIYNDSIASITSQQQYILALTMFFSGINFSLLYQFFTFKYKKLRQRLEQFTFYSVMIVVVILFVVLSLHFHSYYDWETALRIGVVQTTSVITTTGSVVDDTTLWWTPITFLFVFLPLVGGMAGSTTGGLKAMRIIILLRNVRNNLRNRLHPHVVNPLRLNGRPVAPQMVNNVMVIFFIYIVTFFVGLLLLMLCGVDAHQSMGAVAGCLSSYGPGLGASGGFGSYAAFPIMAKWVCVILMLMGRLECLTVLVLLFPRFWKK